MGALQVISCLLLLVALTRVADSYKPKCLVKDITAEPDFNLYKVSSVPAKTLYRLHSLALKAAL